jgi:menaquinone-dependent protoporphyrinogen oxidase
VIAAIASIAIKTSATTTEWERGFRGESFMSILLATILHRAPRAPLTAIKPRPRGGVRVIAMAKILVLFASFDGQAAHIARRIAHGLDLAGHTVAIRRVVEDAHAERDLRQQDAVIVGGAVRYGRHARALENIVREHAVAIAAKPNAFFSVSLSAGGPGARPANAARQIEEFRKRTHWKPRETVAFAGALPYTRYGFFLRLAMRLIVGAAGGDTDTSRDYEYTDWDAVDRFAASFSRRLASDPATLAA